MLRDLWCRGMWDAVVCRMPRDAEGRGMRDAVAHAVLCRLGYMALGDAGCSGVRGAGGCGMLRYPRYRGTRDAAGSTAPRDAAGRAVPWRSGVPWDGGGHGARVAPDPLPILPERGRSCSPFPPHTPPPPLPKLRLLSTPQLVAGGMEWDDHATLRDTHHGCVGTRGHACACANTAGAAGAAAGTPPPLPPPNPKPQHSPQPSPPPAPRHCAELISMLELMRLLVR